VRWQYKALLQRLFSIVPRGEQLNYLFQRYVTRSQPVGEREFSRNIANAKQHLEHLRHYTTRPILGATLYEFGAGSDLLTPLVFHACGVSHQVVVDIRALARWRLVNTTLRDLQRLGPRFSLPIEAQSPPLMKSREQLGNFLRSNFGIEYLAPCDARHTGLASGSIDYITSTYTLEHIPSETIRDILGECRRLLRQGGIMSFLVDYQDHYCYFDSNISAYNFLQYSDRVWSRYNPSLHYQNRLRHRDYLELYRDAGFIVLHEQRREGEAADHEVLGRLPLDTRFQTYPREELAVRSAWVVLQKG